MSFFFGPFPKLLLRDQEKKPRFLSALSSLLSSVSDLPDLCFLASWGSEKTQKLDKVLKCSLEAYMLQNTAGINAYLFWGGEGGTVRAGTVF